MTSASTVYSEQLGCGNLRTELSLRGLRLAAENNLLFERTDGSVPGIVFGLGDDGRHGNFHPSSFEQICRRPEWAKRREKAHTCWKRMRVRANWEWKELDCANSSDALLMNVFCYPDIMNSPGLSAMLGVQRDALPEFGFKPRTTLLSGKCDCTEVDMAVGTLMVEAKLTESDFQRARLSLLSRYRDFEAVFDVPELAKGHGKLDGYQLMRGALAAYGNGRSFCVLCDSRRPHLIETWYRVMRAVRPYELRSRLKLLTWQELAAVVPTDLQDFLSKKYGIVPAL